MLKKTAGLNTRIRKFAQEKLQKIWINDVFNLSALLTEIYLYSAVSEKYNPFLNPITTNFSSSDVGHLRHLPVNLLHEKFCILIFRLTLCYGELLMMIQ